MEPAPAGPLTQLQVSQYLEQLLPAIPVGVVAVDGRGIVIAHNEAAAELLVGGRGTVDASSAAERPLGARLADYFDEPDAISGIITESLRDEPRTEVLQRLRDRQTQHVEVIARRVTVPTDEPVGLLVLQEVTQRVVAERDLKRAVLDREFLMQSGGELSKSLDYQTTLETLVRMVISYLADWCTVNMVEDDGSITRASVAHVDPAKEALIAELHDSHPHDPSAQTGVPRVLQTGEPELYAEIGHELIELTANSPEYLRIVTALGMDSCIIVPLIAHGETLGAMTLVSSRTTRRYDETHLEIAVELGLRAGLALYNARLFQTVEDNRAKFTSMARTLQRSLLPPELPSIPGAEIAALYRPATGSLEVGGDFYDLFETSDGDWGLVMGDVQGHGAMAAATTALARYTLRAIAQRLSRPIHVLYQVNKALLRQGDDRFLSAVFATVTPGSPPQVTIASAGHPRPMIIRSDDGRVESAGGEGMLLGLFTAPDLNEQIVDLQPGDALVMYTDGLTEAGAPRTMLGEEGLRQVLARCVDLSASDICASIDEVLLTWQSERGHRDDCAALVLRVPPETRANS
ncbi:MAG: SpoIIE family protein phosphatase [Actinomycetota bacterium]